MIVINARFLTQKITGVQRFAIEISKEIKKAHPEVIFLSPSNIIQHDAAAELGVITIGTHTGAFWEQYDLSIYLYKNNQPLLINLCNAAPLLYKNQIVTIHDLAFIVNPDWFSKKFVAFYKFMIPRIAKKSKLTLTVSEFSRQEIITNLNIAPDKIKVAYNGISTLPIESTASIDGKYILAVGSIEKRKNLQILIQAFNKVQDNTLKLLIAGDVSAIFNNKNNNMQANGQIVFLGRVNDTRLSQLYSNALMFVYPSLYEGFGIPPLEAMFYGCPTLVSDIGSLREVCDDSSIFVDPNSVDDISQKIKLLATNEALRNNLTEKGKQNINRFSWQTSAEIIFNAAKSLQ